MSDPVTDALKIAHYEPALGRLSPSETSMVAEPEPVRDIHKRALDAAGLAPAPPPQTSDVAGGDAPKPPAPDKETEDEA